MTSLATLYLDGAQATDVGIKALKSAPQNFEVGEVDIEIDVCSQPGLKKIVKAVSSKYRATA